MSRTRLPNLIPILIGVGALAACDSMFVGAIETDADELDPVGLGDADDGPVDGDDDAGIPDGAEVPMGDVLATTGLCVDAACTQIASGVLEFRPRWQLWTDGATKRRWIFLPPGTRIDTTSMDYWRFPVGTKLWKEFTRDGVKVETRFMMKAAAGDAAWTFRTFVWNADGSNATPAPSGGVQNVNGTPHDIPPTSRCTECHANVKSRVLGFSAFQLDHDTPPGIVDVDEASAKGWFTQSPSGQTPHWPLPGTSVDKAALGYFHANCGHCHNSDSPLVNRPMFRLEIDYVATLESTRTYSSSVNVSGQDCDGATIIAKPGDPDHSIIITRMKTLDLPKRMPPLGIETPDPTGASIARQWILSL